MRFSAVLLIGALASRAAPLLAQGGGAAPAGAVSGTVVASTTGQPVPGAVIILESASDASVISPSGGPFVSRSLLAVTDASGAYRFSALPAGQYRLIVRHMGFRPAEVDVDLAQAAPFRVSVALVVNPIRLDALDLRGATPNPYGRVRTVADEIRFGKLDAEQFRDQRFLEGDAAVLTHADVTEAVTLGETDIFRAVQRLPGVSTRDDFTASLWTRGAPWSQTRVYFDGLPLFNPVHAAGIFSAVNTDAIGVASFHPGVRSVAIGEGAAGILDISSRRPTRPGFGGLGELSVISAHGAGDWASRGGRVSGMLAARRSWVDFATRIAEALGSDSNTYFPYAFYDVTGRFDADLGKGFGLEASGLWEQDDVRGNVPRYLNRTRGNWGNRLGRVTLMSPLGPLRARSTVGVSDFFGVLGRPTSGSDTIGAATPVHAPTRNGMRVVTLGTTVAPVDAGARPTWSAGLQLAAHEQNFAGPYPRPYPVVVLPESLSLRDRLDVVSLWGERRLGLGRHAAVEAGLRAELHRPVRNAPGVGLAPKLAVRATPPGTRFTFSAAASRSWQYAQALAPAGPSIGPDLYVTDVWLLATDTVPAVRSDIATVGVETSFGVGWAASLNLYARRATGVAVPEPSPGALRPLPGSPSGPRPIFVLSRNDASGAELSVRRIVGVWTASASFSLGRSMMHSPSGYTNLNGATYTYPSSSDRPRVLDLMAMMRLGSSWRVGGAFTAASGAPFSRFIIDADCDSAGLCTGDSSATIIENPNAERAPGYASLDLLADWSKTLHSGTRIGAFLQIRNVLNIVNAVTYTGTLNQCTTPHPPTLVPAAGRFQLCDRFSKGVPIMPLAGIRIAF